MAKHLSVLRRFAVSSDDGGMWIEHRYEDCDWLVTIGEYRLTDLMRQANAHAKVCDGKPQPRPERTPSPSKGFIPELWGTVITSALQSSLVFERCVAEPSLMRGLEFDRAYTDKEGGGGTVSV